MAYDKINAEIIPEGFEIHPNFQNLDPEMKVAVMSGIRGDKGDKGDTGSPGQNGRDGQDGAAATITVGTVTTGDPDDPASVTNVGTSTAAVFDFVIPKGDKGDSGGGGATGFNINFTFENNGWSCDQTYADLVDAIEDGEIINAVISVDGINYEGQFVYEPSDGYVVFTFMSAADTLSFLQFSSNGTFDDSSVRIPQDTADLTNTAGFITSSDIPVTSVNNQTGAVTISVPTKTSDLNNDSGFLTSETDPVFSASEAASITSSDVSNWNGKAETSDIPTDVSDLNNDAGYITSSDIPVTSVNSKTGAVSLTATDVGALPSSTVIPPKTVWYGTSSTTGSTTTKVVTTSSGDFTLTSGNVLIVKFTYGHSASSLGSNMKLKVDGLDAKVMGITNSSYISQYEWSDGAVMEFVYDGSQFIITNGRHAGTSSYGVTILSSSTTSTSESAAATPKAVKTVMDAIPTVPTNVSAFTNDAGYLTSAPVTSVNSKTGAVSLSATDVGALPDTTTIPTDVSDLNNDLGFMVGVNSATIFVQGTAPSTAQDGDIWVDTSQDAIPSANGEEF